MTRQIGDSPNATKLKTLFPKMLFVETISNEHFRAWNACVTEKELNENVS